MPELNESNKSGIGLWRCVDGPGQYESPLIGIYVATEA